MPDVPLVHQAIAEVAEAGHVGNEHVASDVATRDDEPRRDPRLAARPARYAETSAPLAEPIARVLAPRFWAGVISMAAERGLSL